LKLFGWIAFKPSFFNTFLTVFRPILSEMV
jgi:hypothetical protein